MMDTICKAKRSDADGSRLTVIMTCFNRAAFLRQAIDSVLEQKTDFDFKLLIADDRSTDGCVEIIKEYARKYPRTVRAIFSDKNEGCFLNGLKALKLTKTDYFCFLDADDYWIDSRHLQKAYDFLEKNRDYAIYGASALVLDMSGNMSPMYPSGDPCASFTFAQYLSGGNVKVTHTSATVYRNVIFKDGVPARILEVTDNISNFAYRGDTGRYVMHLRYGKAFFVNEPHGVYRQHEKGIWTSLNLFERHVVQAASYLEYINFFDGSYEEFFYKKAWVSLCAALNELNLVMVKRLPFNADKALCELFFESMTRVLQEHE